MSFDRIAGLVLETNNMPQRALDTAAPPDLTARDALPALVMSNEVAACTAIVLLQRAAPRNGHFSPLKTKASKRHNVYRQGTVSGLTAVFRTD